MSVKTDPLPDEIASRIDARYQLSQCRLYNNGTIYTNKTGRKQIAKIMLAGKVTDAVLQENTTIIPQGRGKRSSVLGNSDKNISLAVLAASRSSSRRSSAVLAQQTLSTPYVFGSSTNIPSVPNWAGLTLSKKFSAATKLRTTKLVEPFNIYDRKRITYQHELAQFF